MKKLKNWSFCQKHIFCPIWRFRQFWRDRTKRKDTLRRHRPRVSNFLSHRIVGFFKIMIFGILGKSLHHQMILGPPDASLDFFLNTRGFWLNGLRRKSILKNVPQKKQIWETKTPQKSSFVDNQASFFMHLCWVPCRFFGSHGARDRMGPK